MTADDVARPLPASVHRAVAFVHDNAARPITLADITAAAGVRDRALQLAFRRHYDTTPLGYLMRVRLEHTHHELQAADPTQGDSVATIAARWQFTHPSHFAAHYRRAYGQTPSHTLRTSPGTSPSPVAVSPPARYGEPADTSRERLFTTRPARADERDQIADERDRAADERDRIADERDRIADEREKTVGQRERHLDTLEERLRDQLQRLDARAGELIAESRDAVQRSKEAADRSLARLDRSAALLASGDRRAEREQLEIDQEVTASGQMLEE